MIDIVVSHPNYPDDPTAEASECLNQVQIHHSTHGSKISFADAVLFDRGFQKLKSKGFNVSLIGSYRKYSN